MHLAHCVQERYHEREKLANEKYYVLGEVGFESQAEQRVKDQNAKEGELAEDIAQTANQLAQFRNSLAERSHWQGLAYPESLKASMFLSDPVV